jgi:dipeptidase E
MKFYLSSYKIGNQGDKLKEMAKTGNKKVAYISNALDFSTDLKRRMKSEQADIDELVNLEFTVEKFDLRDYFDSKDNLEKDISQYDIIGVRGGNTFVLRQAMKLSGFDKLLINLSKRTNNIIYGGYSAGVCVLAPNLHGLELLDDVGQFPYPQQKEVIFAGLGILNYAVVPHYKSEKHSETEAVEKVIEYYIKNKILFKALSDGEVIIIE